MPATRARNGCCPSHAGSKVKSKSPCLAVSDASESDDYLVKAASTSDRLISHGRSAWTKRDIRFANEADASDALICCCLWLSYRMHTCSIRQRITCSTVHQTETRKKGRGRCSDCHHPAYSTHARARAHTHTVDFRRVHFRRVTVHQVVTFAAGGTSFSGCNYFLQVVNPKRNPSCLL